MMRNSIEIYDHSPKGKGKNVWEVITLMLMSGGIFTTVAAATQEFAPSHLNPRRRESITLSRNCVLMDQRNACWTVYPKPLFMTFCLAYLSATS
jgi:hypothetical protein